MNKIRQTLSGPNGPEKALYSCFDTHVWMCARVCTFVPSVLAPLSTLVGVWYAHFSEGTSWVQCFLCCSCVYMCVLFTRRVRLRTMTLPGPRSRRCSFCKRGLRRPRACLSSKCTYMMGRFTTSLIIRESHEREPLVRGQGY